MGGDDLTTRAGPSLSQTVGEKMILSRTLEKLDELKKDSCKRTKDFLN